MRKNIISLVWGISFFILQTSVFAANYEPITKTKKGVQIYLFDACSFAPEMIVDVSNNLLGINWMFSTDSIIWTSINSSAIINVTQSGYYKVQITDNNTPLEDPDIGIVHISAEKYKIANRYWYKVYNDAPEIENPDNISFSYEDKIVYYKLVYNENTYSNPSFNWTAPSLIDIKDAGTKDAYFKLPQLSQKTPIDIKLEIEEAGVTKSVVQTLELPILTEQRRLGLGLNTTVDKSSNISYEWYISQFYTGRFSNINCGPTSVTMALTWHNDLFIKTVEDAREKYRSGGGWWYTNDIINYLNDYNAPNVTIALSGLNMNALDNYLNSEKNTAILCLDIYYVRSSIAPYGFLDKHYTTSSTGSGHFIVIKGYKVVDGEKYYEVYDPWTMNVQSNDDDTPAGRGRYYRESDLVKATNVWWKYAIIVSRPGYLRNFIDPNIVDPNEIEHNGGVLPTK